MMFFQLHKNIQIRIITSFLSRSVGAMVFPFMAIYFTNTLSATWAGILLLINVIASLVTGLYGGYVADRVGRKRVMMWGQSITVGAFLLMAFVNSPWFASPWLTFLSMLIISSASGLINPAAEAMLIDVSTKETRAFMYSINYWAVNLSVMIGAMVGGWFFKTHRFELFLALTLIAVITWVIMAIWMTEEYKIVKKQANVNVMKDLASSYKLVIKDKPFMIFTLASILVFSLEFQRNNYIAVRLEEGFGERTLSIFGNEFVIDGIRMLSLITTENTLMIVLLTVVVAAWIKKQKELPLLYWGSFIQAVGFGILAFHNNMFILFLACFVQTMGEMLFIPVRQAKMAELMDDGSRGAYMAINGFVFQGAKIIGALGIIVGSMIGGIGMAILYLILGVWSIWLFRSVLEEKRAFLFLKKSV